MIINNERFDYYINKINSSINPYFITKKIIESFYKLKENSKDNIYVNMDNGYYYIIFRDYYLIFINLYFKEKLLHKFNNDIRIYINENKYNEKVFLFNNKQLIKILNNYKKIDQEELIKEAFKSERIENRINIYTMEYLDFEY